MIGEIVEHDVHAEWRTTVNLGRHDNFVDGDLAASLVTDRHAIEADARGEHFRRLRQSLADIFVAIAYNDNATSRIGRQCCLGHCKADSRFVNCGSFGDSMRGSCHELATGGTSTAGLRPNTTTPARRRAWYLVVFQQR